MNGVTILFVYAVIMILATVILTKKEKNVERFCVGSRSENWLMSALSIAATWIWAPALFVSTEKAYSTGWVGLFWFLVPNALCLVIFIPFAKKIRKEMPEGMTLSGYMKEKYQSDGVKRVYLFQLIGLSVLSTGVQLLAGSQILSAVTGISFKTMTILLACIAISYSLFSGIKASMLTDAIQMVFMLVACSLFVIFGVRNTGTQGIIQGLSGISGDCTTLFSGKGVEIFLAFGLPTTIGLLSGPFGDQSFWQSGSSKRQMRVSQFFSVDTARSLVKMNEYYPDLMERIIRREPNAYLAALYWDSEMFGRSSRKRKEAEEGQEQRDYRQELIHLFNHMDVFFDTPHKRHVAERYRNFFMAVSAIATSADCKHIYEGLISGDPKMRAFRALYQRVYGRYINDAKKGEYHGQ